MSKNNTNVENNSESDTGLSATTSPSLESAASITSGTIGRYTGEKFDESDASNLVTCYGRDLFDTVSAIIVCPTHNRMALRQLSETKGIFFPSAPVRTGQGWQECATNLIKEVLRVSDQRHGSKHSYLSFSEPRMVNVTRIQIPVYCEFISRICFFCELTSGEKSDSNCCSKAKNVKWFRYDSIIGYKVKEMWGSEPIILAEALSKKMEINTPFVEFLIKDVIMFVPKDSIKTLQQEMIKGSGLTEKSVFDIFGEYLQHTYPSQYMTLYSFEDYLTRFGFPQLNPGFQLNFKALFRSFGYNGLEYLSFNEFLLGLCSLDKNSVHKNLRVAFIFRYYSKNYSNGVYLEIEDLKVLARDMIRVRSSGQIKDSDVDKEVQQILTAADSQQKRRIDQKTFLKIIGELRVRNTSSLLRSMTSIAEQIQKKRVYESIQLTQIQCSTAVGAKIQRIRGTCQRCKQKKYTLASHTVRLSKDGFIVDPQENKGQSDVQRMAAPLRRQSNKCFMASNVANVILDTIRSFAIVTGLCPGSHSSDRTTRTTAKNWSNKNNRQQMMETIESLLNECEDIFKKESRVLRVCSPVFVLGDIHGNLHDVMIYERALWKMGPTCIASDFLFLGDYVDRGEHSVECILYLLSLKYLCPQKYWLLRGNHELRGVQQQFTFKTECLDKFGNKVGLQLWEAFNRVFDMMPVCAIIDDSIFCAHGGIPTSSLKVEELYKMPFPLEDPENQFPNAWQMLWNDPVTNQEFREYEENLRQSGASTRARIPGFLANTKRGTAYYYSDEALTNFLSANQLSHVIRAHEVIPNGYAFHMGGKCTTIFSSSKYCGGLNEAAVILVNDEKIRIVKIDTSS